VPAASSADSLSFPPPPLRLLPLRSLRRLAKCTCADRAMRVRTRCPESEAMHAAIPPMHFCRPGRVMSAEFPGSVLPRSPVPASAPAFWSRPNAIPHKSNKEPARLDLFQTEIARSPLPAHRHRPPRPMVPRWQHAALVLLPVPLQRLVRLQLQPLLVRQPPSPAAQPPAPDQAPSCAA